MSETFSAVLAAGISMPVAAGILVVLVILAALYMKSRNSDSAAGQEEPAAAPAPAPAPAAAPAPVAPAVPAAPAKPAPAVQQGIPAPVVAAIAAAVQAFGGGAYTLRSVEKAPEAAAAAPAAPVQGRRAWARAALAESTRPF